MFFNQYPYWNINDLNLDFILKHVKDLIAALNQLDGWKVKHESEYLALKKMVDDLYAGNFSTGFADALVKWYKENITDIIGEFVKLVIFNITDDGYFVAYIPESWNDIIFGTTGLDEFIALQPEYGHLVLSYEAENNVN
jgi:hypothetical protein